MTAHTVAKYIIHTTSFDDDSDVTNLKLQKLLYYAQGYHLAFTGKPFFKDDIYAWRYGPVCPEVYKKYSRYRAEVIPNTSNIDFEEHFSNEQMDLLDEIIKEYGQYSAWRLRDMTHQEPTWRNHSEKNDIIPKEEIKKYFKQLI